MNDVQFVEAARRLAERAIKAGTSFDQRLDFMTARVLARPFDKEERQVALAAYRDFVGHYASRVDEARKLISAGESQPDTALPAPEVAAWTMMASQVVNLDEAVNK